MTSAGSGVADPSEDATSRQFWKWSFVAAMAGYIDAGSIVAGSVGLGLWVRAFDLSESTVGLLGAFSSNAISAGVGALIGGYVCDKYGRKKIYAYDLLLYMFGTLWIIFAVNTPMLFVGYVIVGLTVGADIPASWSLITEFSPAGSRGKFGALAQVLWSLGPVVTLLLGLALQPLGMLGIRLLFAHLFLVALVTWWMRHGVGESARWKREVATGAAASGSSGGLRWIDGLRPLLSRRALPTMLFLIGMYGIWNLFAGTNGFYYPYLLQVFGSQSEAASVGLQSLYFLLVALFTGLVFMPLNDRINRRLLFALSSLIQMIGVLFLALLPLNFTTALGYILAIGIGGGFGAQHFFQLWSGELFPTRLRSTAQGLMFAVVRIALGVWSFFVPLVTATGFRNLAFILAGFLFVSGVIGTVFGPRTEGRTLEEIETSGGWQRYPSGELVTGTAATDR
ncbi:MFS transporter, SP family, inositol transporter [Actinopolyspora xinjiangensis]|uniref:MFS transporter, SP family, inositol transporter n=1 Tax=Actinopolyspora xinjiangensis TaxID=405564 RepID=A0A1H0RXM1_9ACTN|nr:MFS transporter [Actinopolyspora xinjiangensis]SDP34137.1 MFS transporter, SP family, inositol transporter [Actinopolyspora xinjiangensis]